ncbi:MULTISPECIES: hypothetical protein [Sodalis]|uniref:hypothetical protein n=1 Tax=Sodalis TaxID=84565 RepID=UPI00105136FB|nr:hypothetical protein [Sodalis ligni]
MTSAEVGLMILDSIKKIINTGMIFKYTDLDFGDFVLILLIIETDIKSKSIVKEQAMRIGISLIEPKIIKLTIGEDDVNMKK